MRKKIIFLLPFLLTFLLIATPALSGGVKQLREENKALRSDLNSAVTRITEAETQIESLQNQLGTKGQELKTLSSDLDALEIKLDELEKLMRTEGSELMKEVMSLREKKGILEDQIEKFENDIAITSKQVEQLNLIVKDYQEELQEKSDENKYLAQEISELDKTVNDLRNSLSAQNEDYSRQLTQLNTEKQSLENEIIRLEEAMKDLRSDLNEERNQSSKQIADLTASNEEMKAEISVLRQNVDSLSRTLTTKEEEYSKQVTELRDEKEELQKQVTQLNSEKKGLENNVVDLKRELNIKLAAEEADKEKMKKTYEQLVSSLKKEVGEKTIEIQNYENALTINIMEKIFFDSGKAQIKPAGLDVLRRVGAIIKDLPDKIIRIDGHTDDVPIGPKLVSIYPNNWELGAARASNVAEYFRTKSGINPERLMVVSYSMYKPIFPNISEENRAKNRRIEIVLQDKSLYNIIKMVESEQL
jgi:chemotaxis protein MotB